MFGSFMPFGGRSKATSLSGAPDEGPMSKLGRGLGNAFGQARGETNPGGQFMPPQAFGQERAMGPMGGFGQMIGGMFGGRMGQMGQQPEMPPKQMPFGITPFNPNPNVQQLPPNPYGGAVPGDLSNMPGRIGDMYRKGQIQTFGGPRAMGPSFGMF